MLVLFGILVLCGIVMLPRVLLFGDRYGTHLGWMSERWLAEYRASHETL
jgi:hypothetical protein